MLGYASIELKKCCLMSEDKDRTMLGYAWIE